MRILLINPPIVSQKWDITGSDIPYLPYTLAYLAAYLRSKKHEVIAIDAFGERPQLIRKYKNGYEIRGLNSMEIVEKVPTNVDVICVIPNSVTKHSFAVELVKDLRKIFQNIPIIVAGNIFSVVVYPMSESYEEYLKAGADFVVLGEAEIAVSEILMHLQGKKNLNEIYGIAFFEKGNIVLTPIKFIEKLDDLPFPAYDIIPLQNYWSLRYAHGPKKGKYLPLITSRGCPYACKFCASNAMHKGNWRSRSPKNVVDEIEAHIKKYGVSDFHIEDLNPTIDKKRIQEICKEITKRRLNITWKIVAGTKAETLDKNTIEEMARAGCKYISISPESGSERILKLMGKPFDHEHQISLVKHLNTLGIKTQACFVIGFPGESPQDLKLTKAYIHKLAIAGVDEIALFIAAPMPGSDISKTKWEGLEGSEGITFSPSWRKDFSKLNYERYKLALYFLFIKSIYHPKKILQSILNILSCQFDLKIEMAIYKLFKRIFHKFIGI